MSKGFSLGTGEVMCFGGVDSFKREPGNFQSIAFPETMGPVNVVKVCNNALILLQKGLTCRFGQDKDEYDAAFEALADLQIDIVDCVKSSGGHFLALSMGGSVYSWGNNSKGQLGLGHTRNIETPTLVSKFMDLDRVTRISVGYEFSVALTSSGDVYVWGDGMNGQCCGKYNCLVPRYVSQLQDKRIVDITCGYDFVAVRDRIGHVYTWGSGLHKEKKISPTKLLFNDDNNIIIIDISAGSTHLALITSKYELYTFGLGIHGQLGQGVENTMITNPTIVSGFDMSITSEDGAPSHVVCGSSYTAVVTTTGALYTFGHNKYGRLGHDYNHNIIYKPTKITTLGNRKVSQIGCGDEFLTCFVATYLTQLKPSALSTAGGSDVSLSGFGLYETNSTIAVNFFYNNENFTVEGTYNVDTGLINAISPCLIDNNNNNNNKSSTGACAISISLDGKRYSNSLPVHVYRDPLPETALPLQVSHGSFNGNTPICMKVDFDCIPYGPIEVCFIYYKSDDEIMKEKEEYYNLNNNNNDNNIDNNIDIKPMIVRIVSAIFDPDEKAILFTSPSFPQPKSNKNTCRTQVHVSLDGQHSIYLNQDYSFYRIESIGQPIPNVLSYNGGEIMLTCSGILYDDNISIAFYVNSFEDSAHTFIRPSRTVTVHDIINILWKKHAITVMDDTNTYEQTMINMDNVIHWIQTTSVLCCLADRSTIRLCSIYQNNNQNNNILLNKQELKQYIQILLSMHEEESVRNEQYISTLYIQTPSFLDYGTCTVSLGISLNNVDYTKLDSIINIANTKVTSIVPNCGPVRGRTVVQVHGDLFYDCQQISVKLVPQIITIKSRINNNNIDNNTLTNESTSVTPSHKEHRSRPHSRAKSSKESRRDSSKSNNNNDNNNNNNDNNNNSNNNSNNNNILSEIMNDSEELKKYEVYIDGEYIESKIIDSTPLPYERNDNKRPNITECLASSTNSTSSLIMYERKPIEKIQLEPHIQFIASNDNINEGSYICSIAMNPLENAYSIGYPFIFYQDPIITEISNIMAAMEGGTEFSISSLTGFFDSSCILIRLSLVEDDVKAIKDKEIKEREKRIQIAADKKKRERVDTEKKTRNKSKSKSSRTKETSSESRLITPKISTIQSHENDISPSTTTGDNTTIDVSIDYTVHVIVVPGIFHSSNDNNNDNITSKSSKRDEKASKKKKRSGKSKNDINNIDDTKLNIYDEYSTISFISPPAVDFGHYGAEGQCQVSIEIALNGQEYINTGKTYKYEQGKKDRLRKKGRERND